MRLSRVSLAIGIAAIVMGLTGCGGFWLIIGSGDLGLELSVSDTTSLSGQEVTIKATAHGGSGSYSYEWYIDGVRQYQLNAATIYYTPSAGSSSVIKTVTCVVSDDYDEVSASVKLTVSPSTATLQIVNQSGSTINVLYVSPSSQGTWGENQLAANGDIIPVGASYDLTGISPGTYDVQAQSNGTVLETRYNVQLSAGFTTIVTVD